MKGRVIWLLLSGLLAAVLVLASCTPAAPAGPTEEQTVTGKVKEGTTPATEEEEEEEEEVTAVTPTDTGPKYGGTIGIYEYTEPVSLDPADASWQIEMATGFYMERLGVGNFWEDGPRGSNKYAFTDMWMIADDVVTPHLAESWEVASDLSSITFYLRKGIRWQNKPPTNGREFVADDVVYSMNRLNASPKTAEDRFEWWGEWKAVDKYTVVLELSYFNANWNYLIGRGAFNQIVAPELGEGNLINDWRNAVGTGPWIVADFVSGSTLTYVRNPDYWRKAVIDGKEYQVPFADRAIAYYIPDASTRVAALRAGKLDVLHSVGWVDSETLDESNPELMRQPYLSCGQWELRFRVDSPPFDDVRVRKALNMAFDRQAMIDSLHGGVGVLLNRPIGSTFPETLYTPIDKLPPDVAEQFEYNPEKAKQLLADAGHPSGFKTEVVTMAYMADPLAMVKEYWAAVGVELEITVLESAAFYSQMYAREYQWMVAASRGCAVPFTEMRANRPGQIWNLSNYDDPVFEEMWARMKVDPDPVTRSALIKEMNVRMLEQVLTLYMPVRGGTNYWQPWIKNYYGEVGIGYGFHGLVFAHAWVDQDLKKEMGK